LKYHLIHITTGGEFKTPLVASQLFDQAEVQATTNGENTPATVSAWTIEPMRLLWDKQARESLNRLRRRCPSISIKLVPGVSRLAGFPSGLFMILSRMLKGSAPAIYHCRGESALQRVIFLKKWFPKDRFVLDVRGHWPSELLYLSGITDVDHLDGNAKELYEREEEKLRSSIKMANAITTVSDNLRELLISKYGAGSNTTVVPCCVKSLSDRSQRNKIRTELGYAVTDKVIVYSGTTASYQHLPDLTLPFMKRLTELSENVKILLLTPDSGKMAELVQAAGISEKSYIIRSLPQEQVGVYLSAADAGVLIRRPTLVNKVAQPVKIAEYLAAGLRMIIEAESVGISPELIENQVVYCIHSIMHSNKSVLDQDALAVLSFMEKEQVLVATQEFVKSNFVWEKAIQKHRKTYSSILNLL